MTTIISVNCKEDIELAIAECKKVKAIKVLRAATGLDLKSAKHLINRVCDGERIDYVFAIRYPNTLWTKLVCFITGR